MRAVLVNTVNPASLARLRWHGRAAELQLARGGPQRARKQQASASLRPVTCRWPQEGTKKEIDLIDSRARGSLVRVRAPHCRHLAYHCTPCNATRSLPPRAHSACMMRRSLAFLGEALKNNHRGARRTRPLEGDKPGPTHTHFGCLCVGGRATTSGRNPARTRASRAGVRLAACVCVCVFALLCFPARGGELGELAAGSTKTACLAPASGGPSMRRWRSRLRCDS